MLLLCLNTASKQSAIALLEKDRILAETAWISDANESEKLLPGLEQLLTDSEKTWDDLTHIAVVEGPGGYTSLRVGITMANAIAWVKKIPMFSVSVFEVWENRLPKNVRKEPHAIAIAAGKDQFLVKAQEKGKIMTLDELKNLKMPCYGEVPEKVKLASFGEAMKQIDFQNRATIKSVQPVYTRPPLITKRRGS